jgi:hypothetical protein
VSYLGSDAETSEEAKGDDNYDPYQTKDDGDAV